MRRCLFKSPDFEHLLGHLVHLNGFFWVNSSFFGVNSGLSGAKRSVIKKEGPSLFIFQANNERQKIYFFFENSDICNRSDNEKFKKKLEKIVKKNFENLILYVE